MALWLERLAPERPIGTTLLGVRGPVAAIRGPAYQRVLVGASPGLSVLVVDVEGSTRILELAPRWCALCTERVHFAQGLIADVARRGRDSHRLLPGVELDLTAHHDAHGLDQDWIGVLSLRDGQGAHLVSALRGARVVGQQDDVVTVAYADGSRDTWRITWSSGRWRIDYAALADDSPLRMSSAQARHWKRPEHRATSALEAWRPSFRTLDGVGLAVGQGAVDAWPDPRDGTVLVVVLDVDRVLTAVFRVDPETRQVLERIPAPLADPRTQLPLKAWGERWPTSLSADGTQLALTGPNRIWRLSLRDGQKRLVSKGEARWLAFEPGTRDRLWAGRAHSLLIAGNTGTERRRTPSAVLGVVRAGDRTSAVAADGSWFDIDTGEVLGQVCCGGVHDTAPHPLGGRLLASCAKDCDHAAAWVSADTVTPVPGAGSSGPGASCSPTGRWFTTSSSSGLLLWDAERGRPAARLPLTDVRTVRWSPDGTHLVTVGGDGVVGWWSVDRIRAAYAL